MRRNGPGKWGLAGNACFGILLVLVLVLVLENKREFDYEDENEDEDEPMQVVSGQALNGVFTPYTVCGNCLMLAWNDQLTAPRDKAFRKARRSQPGDMKQKTIVRSQRFVTALQVHLKQGTRAILQPPSGAPAPTAGRYFQSGSDRAQLDPAPVWSSAFRRFGAFTHPGRINAELQTQRQRSSGAVFRCTRSHPRSLAIF